MKRLSALLLALAMVFSLAACGEPALGNNDDRRDSSSQSDRRKDKDTNKGDSGKDDDRTADKGQPDASSSAEPSDPSTFQPLDPQLPSIPFLPDLVQPGNAQPDSSPLPSGGLTASPAETFQAEGLWYICTLLAIDFDSASHTLTLSSGETEDSSEPIPYTFDPSTGSMTWTYGTAVIELHVGANENGLLQMNCTNGVLPGTYLLTSESNTFSAEGTWYAALWLKEQLPVLELSPERGFSMYAYTQDDGWQITDSADHLPFGLLEFFNSLVVFDREGSIVMELPIYGWLNGIAVTEMGGMLVALAPAPADLLDR